MNRHGVGPLTAALLILALVQPAAVTAHSELVSSNPEDGEVIEVPPTWPPFGERIKLTFSAPLADGSEAHLISLSGFTDPETGIFHPGGGPGAPAAIDHAAGTMLFPDFRYGDDAVLRIEWTSVSEDGDVLRGTINFEIVRVVPTNRPTQEPTSEPSASATAMAVPPPSPSPSPSPTPTPDPGSAAGAADVILPIIVALVVVVGGGAYFLTRRRPTING